LGDALSSLLRDPAHARRLGEAGRRRAESEFNHETLVRRIEGIYQAALNGTVDAWGAEEAKVPSAG
jgi:glycosyltransferase involved in cell wall biosynthesis